MARSNVDGRETSRTLDLVLVNCSPFISATFCFPPFSLSPPPPPPSSPPALSPPRRLIPFCSPREFEIADCCWRRVQTREEDCSCARKKGVGGRREGREKDREKAEANGVTWPKDAKLPKRSTRKAWSAPITGPLLAAIMIIAYLERERSCARALGNTRVSAACTYTRAYTGCPAIIHYHFLARRTNQISILL